MPCISSARRGTSFELFEDALAAGGGGNILIDRFLDDAIEVDVDCIGDGERYVIGGIMEHIEEAGVHSGDSACCLPPHSLSQELRDEIARQTIAMARELEIVGLMNVQFAIQEQTIYVLEVNPRASRTIPFVSKTIGHPLAKYAARVMVGQTLEEIGLTDQVIPPHYAVKESVFPFRKFPGVDVLLGPEMRSTGEVMGIDKSFPRAFIKAQVAASNTLPEPVDGKIFISVRNTDKPSITDFSRDLAEIGFTLVATEGTARHLREHDIPVETINKVKEGRPHIVDAIINGEISMVINTTVGRQSVEDSKSIRQQTLRYSLPYFTTIAGARAAAAAMKARLDWTGYSVQSLQEYS